MGRSHLDATRTVSSEDKLQKQCALLSQGIVAIVQILGGLVGVPSMDLMYLPFDFLLMAWIGRPR